MSVCLLHFGQVISTCVWEYIVSTIANMIILYCHICNCTNNCIPTHMIQKTQPLYDYKNNHFIPSCNCSDQILKWLQEQSFYTVDLTIVSCYIKPSLLNSCSCNCFNIWLEQLQEWSFYTVILVIILIKY